MATIDDVWTSTDWEQMVSRRQVDGGGLTYLDVTEAGDPDAPAIVLLHGMGACWQWWLEVLPALASRHRVIAVDLPGFGASDPLVEPAELSTHADRVAGLLAGLGITDAIVVGHSMGGLVAMALEERHPAAVGRLVLVGSGGFPMSPRRLAAVLTFLRLTYAWLTRPWVLRRLVESRSARAVLLRAAMVRPAAMSPELAAAVVPSLAAPGFLGAVAASSRAIDAVRPQAITVPTLLLWGERDAFAPLAAARDLHRQIPDSRLEIIVGVGHSPMIEAPREFAESVLRFAREVAR